MGPYFSDFTCESQFVRQSRCHVCGEEIPTQLRLTSLISGLDNAASKRLAPYFACGNIKLSQRISQKVSVGLTLMVVELVRLHPHDGQPTVRQRGDPPGARSTGGKGLLPIPLPFPTVTPKKEAKQAQRPSRTFFGLPPLRGGAEGRGRANLSRVP